MKQVFLDKFNSTLTDFVTEINAVVTTQVSNKESDTNTGSKALKKFYKSVQPVAMELSTKNEIVFSKEIRLFDGIDLYSFWNVDLSETTRENTWKYLHTMYLYADNYHRNTNLGEVMKLYHQAGTTEHLNVDHKTKVLFGILDNLNNKSTPKQEIVTTDNREKSIDDLISEPKKSTDKPSMTDGIPLPKSILGGRIGALASEIAKDINPEDFQMENPEEMMKDLMSGKLNQNSPVFNLVNKISSKIQGKLSSGEVDEMELFHEAKGVMSEMGSDSSPFGMLGKMSQTLEKGLGGMSGMEGIFGMEGMIGMDGMANTQTKSGEVTRRQVLKDKLRNKNRQMALRKKLDQVKKGVQ